MFQALLNRLFSPQSAKLAVPDSRLALAALMVRLARADGDYSASERQRIERVLALHHGLSPQEATTMRLEAEVMESEAPDTVRFTRALKDAVPIEQRRDLVTALWSVALADGGRAAEEDGLMRLISNLLGLTDVDSALARQKAAQG